MSDAWKLIDKLGKIICETGRLTIILATLGIVKAPKLGSGQFDDDSKKGRRC